MHLKDEFSDLRRDGGPSRRSPAALSTPVEAETLAVPADDGFRLDEDERSTPLGPAAGEPDPQQPVGAPKPDSPSRLLALENEELVA